MKESVQIKTLVNEIPVDPEKSQLPIILVGDRVLIDPIEPDKLLSKEANIHRPVNMEEDYKKGVLVSIGGGEYGTSIPNSLKVGMTVHYWHKTALDMEIQDKKYHLVRAADVFMYL